MAITYTYSLLSNGQHIAFKPGTDTLNFSGTSDQASSVRLWSSGGNLAVTFAGKTIWLDGFTAGMFSLTNIVFANGSQLVAGDGTTNLLADWYGQDVDLSTSTVGNQVWGLGGADYIHTGSGADYLVGNDALTPLNHVSRDSSTFQNSNNDASISADGRFVGYNNASGGMTVKDMLTGSVTIEDKSSSGVPGNSGSGSPVISADGKHLAFLSGSSNLVAEPDSSALYDIFVAGVGNNAIERVSEGTGGVAAADGRSIEPDISGDGRYVVFKSATSNWAPGGSTATYDIFLKDRVDGSLTRVSTSLSGGDGNADSEHAKVSNDGRFVVFESEASNLTAGDTNGYRDIFVWDGQDGSLTNLTSYMTNVRNAATACSNPDVAFDGGDGTGGYYGGWIVFETGRALVAADQNNGSDIYAFDMAGGTFTLVSSKADGTGGTGGYYNASISGDGRFVVFESYATDLVPNGVGRDILVKDLITGQIALVSKAPDGSAQNAGSSDSEISLGGDWIVFESWSTNLASTDGNDSFSDVFRVSNPLLRDTLEGGAGNDTYVIARNDVIIEALNGGTDTVQSSLSYTLGANLENLLLTGTASLNGTGNTLNNSLTGSAGVNNLSGLAGNDTLNGGSGADNMTGGDGSDAYYVDNIGDKVVETNAVLTSGGSDIVYSTLSAYTLGANVEHGRILTSATANLTGNELNNLLYAGAGSNVINGGISGTDTVSYVYGVTGTTGVTVSLAVATAQATVGSGSDTLAGIENLVGSSYGDKLTGNGGANVLNGHTGNDTLTGGAGNDVYVVDSGGDVIIEAISADIDTVQSSVTWTLQGGLEKLTLTGTGAINGTGNTSANTILGNAAANSLAGGGNNDSLNGGGGNDLLRGDAGNDTLTGATGRDTFRFDAALSSTTNLDQINDFSVIDDTIQLENAIFKSLTLTGALASGNFAANLAGTAVDADDYIVYETDTGKLFYDADGSGAGAAVQFALLTTTPALTSLDFIVT